jgi:hypothetical protein
MLKKSAKLKAACEHFFYTARNYEIAQFLPTFAKNYIALYENCENNTPTWSTIPCCSVLLLLLLTVGYDYDAVAAQHWGRPWQLGRRLHNRKTNYYITTT